MFTSLYLCTYCLLTLEFVLFFSAYWTFIYKYFEISNHCIRSAFPIPPSCILFLYQTVIYDSPSLQLKHNGRENTQRRKRWGSWEMMVGQLICFHERETLTFSCVLFIKKWIYSKMQIAISFGTASFSEAKDPCFVPIYKCTPRTVLTENLCLWWLTDRELS